MSAWRPLRLAGVKPSRQFLGFAIVGAIGFGVDASALLAMIAFAQAGPYAARGVSFALAVTVTWLLNRSLVFASAGRTHRDEYVRYFGVQAVGALINLSIYAMLIETVPAMAAYPVLALSAGAAAALVFNFLAARSFVFNAAGSPDRAGPSKAGEDASGYGGSENLEIMAEAENYNRYLLKLVDRAAGTAPIVLDFGAGQGTFAGPLAERGRNIACVEPDQRLHGFFEAAGLEVHRSVSDIPPDSVDFAYTLNVLEHIEDDVAALKEIRSRMKPGGHLLIYVPAFDLLFSSMDRKVGHVRRYRRGQLTKRVRAAGFDVERSRYVDSLGFLAALAYRVIGSDSGDIDRRALRLYDRFAFPVSLAVDLVASRLFGKNLLLVARRPDTKAR